MFPEPYEPEPCEYCSMILGKMTWCTARCDNPTDLWSFINKQSQRLDILQELVDRQLDAINELQARLCLQEAK